MITTVTLNAAIDRTLVVPNFTLGRRHRSTDATTQAGGHGITIARALRQLGCPIVATGFVGGVTGSAIIERLTDEGIPHDFARVADASRASTAVIDPVTGATSEINEYGPRVDADELADLERRVEHLAGASRCTVVAGSLPRDLATTTYQSLIRTINARDSLSVLASVGDEQVLLESIRAEPSLLVLNQTDAETVAGWEFSGDDDIIAAFDVMVRMGAQSILITSGDSVWARIKRGPMVHHLAATCEPVEVVSRLGTNDVIAAGFISATLAERELPDRLVEALATSMASMRTLGTGIFNPSDIDRLRGRATVRELVEA